MIDCADRMVLAWRFAKRITAEDLAEMLREAVFRRFGEARSRTHGIELLSDNGPKYTSKPFRPIVRAMGLIPCHTPRRSPQSNGLVEAFFGTLQAGLYLPSVFGELGVGQPPAAWLDRALQLQGAAQRAGDALTSRVLCGMDSSKTKNNLSKINWGSTLET